jgi:hypothetical protein
MLERLQRGGAGGGGAPTTKSGFSASHYYTTNATSAGSFLPPAPSSAGGTGGTQQPLDIRRPYNGVGKFSVNIFGNRPVTAPSPETKQMPGAFEGTPLGPVAGALGFLGQIPGVTGLIPGVQAAQMGQRQLTEELLKGHENEYLQWAQAQAKRMQEEPRDWMNDMRMKVDWARMQAVSSGSMSELAAADRLTPWDDNLGGLAQFLMSGMSVAQHGVQRSVAGFVNRADALKNANDQQLEFNPELIAIRDAYKKGEITEDQAMDRLVLEGHGMVNPLGQTAPIEAIRNLANGVPIADTLLEIGANTIAGAGSLGLDFLSDPATLVSLGTAGAVRLTTVGIARTMLRLGQKAGLRAIEEAIASGAIKDATGALAQAVARGDASAVLTHAGPEAAAVRDAFQLGAHNGLLSLEKFVPAGIETTDANIIKYGLKNGSQEVKDALQAAGAIRRPFVANQHVIGWMQKVENVLDPLSIFGHDGAGRAANKALSIHILDGGTNALGKHNIAPVMKALADIGISEEKTGAHLGTAFANVAQQIGGEALARLHSRLGIGVEDGIDPVALTNMGQDALQRYGSSAESAMRHKMEKIGLLVLPREGETMASAVARERTSVADLLTKMYGVSSEDALKATSKMSEKQLGVVRFIWYGNLSDEVLNVRKLSLPDAAAAGLSPGYINRLIYLGPTQLTQQTAELVRKAIKRRDYQALRAMVEKYDLLEWNVSLSQNDADLLKNVREVLDNHAEHLPTAIDTTDPTKLTPAMRAFRDKYGDLAKLGLRSEDIFATGRNADGRIVSVDPFMDYVKAADVGFGDVSPAGVVDQLRSRLLGNISGSQVVLEQNRRFAQAAAQEWGLSREQSDTMMRLARAEAGRARASTSRGLTQDELYRAATKALTPAMKKKIGSRELQRVMFFAHEGSLGKVGLTQKFTGKLKTAEVRLFGSSSLGTISERYYPNVRFRWNAFFQLQESIETPIFLIARGYASPRQFTGPLTGVRTGLAAALRDEGGGGRRAAFKRGRTAGIDEARAIEYQTALMMDSFARGVRYTGDMAEATDMMRVGSAAAAVAGSSEEGRALTALKNDHFVARIKTRGQLIAFRKQVGDDMARMLQRESPASWFTAKAFYNTTGKVGDGEVAVRWFNDMLMRNDPNGAFSAVEAHANPSDFFRPQFLGRRTRWSQRVVMHALSGELPDKYKDMTFGQLRQRYLNPRDTVITEPWLEERLRALGADEWYISRTKFRMEYPTEKQYEAALAAASTPEAAAAHMEMHRIEARAEGLPLIESLADKYAGAPQVLDENGVWKDTTLFQLIADAFEARNIDVVPIDHAAVVVGGEMSRTGAPVMPDISMPEGVAALEWESHALAPHTEMVPMSLIANIQPGNTLRMTDKELASLARDVKANGMNEPIQLTYSPVDNTVRIDEGNHRTAAIVQMYQRNPEKLTGVNVPVTVFTNRAGPVGGTAVTGIEPDEFGYVSRNLRPSQIGIGTEETAAAIRNDASVMRDMQVKDLTEAQKKGRKAQQARIRRVANPELGVPDIFLNVEGGRLVARDSEGNITHRIGGRKTMEEWVEELRSNMTDEELKEHAGWYIDMRRGFMALTENEQKEATYLLMAFGITQLNTSPVAGMEFMWRVVGFMRRKEEFPPDIVQLKKVAGLNGESLAHFMTQGYLRHEGMGQKLIDFVDSLIGMEGRTIPVRGPNGRWGPVAGDVWAKRDVGYLDGKMLNHLKVAYREQYDVEAVGTKLVRNLETGEMEEEAKTFRFTDKKTGESFVIDPKHIGQSAPNDLEYDAIVEFYNNAADHLNEINFLDRNDWTSAEAQALGWFKGKVVMGDATGDPRTAFMHSSYNVRVETPYPGRVLPVGGEANLSRRAVVAHVFPEVGENTQRQVVGKAAHAFSDEAARISGVHVIGSTESLVVHPDGRLGSAVNFEIMGAYDDARLYAAALGAVSHQSRVRAVRATSTTPTKANGVRHTVELSFPSTIHPEEMRGILKNMAEDSPEFFGDADLLPRADGETVIRVVSNEGESLADFTARMDDTQLEGFYAARVSPEGYARGRYVNPDEPMKPGAREAAIEERGAALIKDSLSNPKPIYAIDDDIEGLADRMWKAVQPDESDPLNGDLDANWGGLTIDSHTGDEPKPFGEAKGGGPWTTGIGDTKSLDLDVDEATFKQAVRDYVESQRGVLERPGAALGVFRDLDYKRIDLDVNLVIGTRDEAEAVQLHLKRPGGAYDFTTGRGVYMPAFYPQRANTVTRGYADVIEHTNDWNVNRNGEGYTQHLRQPMQFTEPVSLPKPEKPAKTMQDIEKNLGIPDRGPGRGVMPEFVFRAVSEEDYQDALARGTLQSDGRLNLSAEEGTVASATNPAWYLPGDQRNVADGEHPGRILKIRVDPEHGWFLNDADSYVKTTQPIPMDNIVEVSPVITSVKKTGPRVRTPAQYAEDVGLTPEEMAERIERKGEMLTPDEARALSNDPATLKSIKGKKPQMFIVDRISSGQEVSVVTQRIEKTPRPTRVVEVGRPALEREAGDLEREGVHWGRMVWEEAYQSLAARETAAHRIGRGVAGDPSFDLANPAGYLQSSPRGTRSARFAADAGTRGRRLYQRTSGGKPRGAITDPGAALSTTPPGKRPVRAQIYVHPRRKAADTLAHEQAHDFINRLLQPSGRRRAKAIYEGREGTPPTIGSHRREDVLTVDEQEWLADQFVEYLRQGPDAVAHPALVPLAAHYAKVLKAKRERIAPDLTAFTAADAQHAADLADWEARKAAHDAERAAKLNPQPAPVAPTGPTPAPAYPKATGLTRTAERGTTVEEAAQQAEVAEMVPTSELAQYLEPDREDLVRGSSPEVDKYLDDLLADVKANGFQRPVILSEFTPGGPITLVEGNHRVVVAQEAGITDIPTVVVHADGTYTSPSGLLQPAPVAPTPAVAPTRPIQEILDEANALTGKSLNPEQAARMMELQDELRRAKAAPTAAVPEAGFDIEAQVKAIGDVHKKWSAREKRSVSGMEKDLNALEEQGIDVTDAQTLLSEYDELHPDDFDSRLDFAEERRAIWDQLLDSLEEREQTWAEEAADLAPPPEVAPTAPVSPEDRIRELSDESDALADKAPNGRDYERYSEFEAARAEYEAKQTAIHAEIDALTKQVLADQRTARAAAPPPTPAPVDIGEFPEAPPVPPVKPKGKTREVTLHPDAKALFDTLDKTPQPKNAHNYDMDEQNVLAWMQASHRRADRVSQDLIHFKSDRSWLERSLNHPYFGLYPLSYMWGKVLPEMVEFLMFRPFGVKAPGVALTATNKMYQHVMNAIENDPELQQFMADNEDWMRAIAMLVPGVPWDLPVNSPLWLRRYVEGVATNLQKDIEGKKPESYDAWNAFVTDVDYTKIVGDTVGYTAGPKQGAETLLSYPGLAAKALGAFQPTEEEKAAAEAAAAAGTQVPQAVPGVPQPMTTQPPPVPQQVMPREKPVPQSDVSPDTVEELQNTLGDEYQNVVEAISGGG